MRGDEAILGRDPNSCDIVVNHGSVSRQHAKITKVQNKCFVQDLQSRNGTFVNGEQIQQPTMLQENDRVKICDVLFTFHSDDGASWRNAVAAMVDTSERTFGDVVDADDNASSTIMSALDVQSSFSGVRSAVNAETKLRALMEITKNLGTALALDKVLQRILDSAFNVFPQADRSFIVLKNPERGTLAVRAVKFRREESEDSVRISRTIANHVMEKREAILSADAASDSRFDAVQSIMEVKIRSMMCAPLLSTSGQPLGIVQVDTLDQRTRFQADDLEVLACVATQAAIAVENAQLHEAERKKLALERDLQLAHQVQRRFLPLSSPQLDHYQFFDFYEPANLVGGDYFDYFTVDRDKTRHAVIVADVSGKGISAALLMAKLSSDAKFWIRSEPEPSLAITQLNNQFIQGGADDRFVTMLLFVLDTKQHTLTVVNAGHMSPLVRRKSGIVETMSDEKSGIPLGVMQDYAYEQLSLPIQPGDIYVSFTDGFSEAMNVQGELYGLERLAASIKSSSGSATQLGQTVLSTVRQFVGKTAQSDDMCLLCFGRTDE